MLERWDATGTFEQLRRKNAGGPTFSFIDGPITANNPMGVHHAWGRSLKDLFQRYHAMLGEDQRYQNGFDCQGLWVEVEVEKALGLNSKHEIEAYGLDRFARACRERVAEYSGVQTQQSRRLGMWMDWERSYFTMTDPNISYIWRFLKVCHERGWLYQGHRPMVWCLRCGTSLSQHEVTATDSYRDIVDPSLYVRFRFTDAPGEALVVWTTTPWTLPANVAATVNPDAEYVWVELDGERHVVAKERCEAVFGAGAKVVGQRARRRARRPALRDRLRRPARAGRGRAPRRRRRRLVLDEGTGHRPHRAGLRRRGLRDRPARGARRCSCRSTRRASSSTGYGELAGHSAHEVPDLVVAHLERDGWLFRQEPHEHRYPHCWRCGTKLIFRVVDEWFIRCDEIRQPMIDANATVEWTPSHFGKRMEDWLRNMGDWCISRKRYWGLPLPFWFCEDGHMTVVASRGGAARARDRRARRACRSCTAPGSTRSRSPARSAAPTPSACPRSATAGSTPASSRSRRSATAATRYEPEGFAAGAGRRAHEGRPARPRLLGEVVPGRLDLGDARADPAVVLLAALHVGRARGQGARTSACSATRSCTTSTGRAMHKSWGNAIWFDDAIEKIGADVSRWMFAGQDTGQNMNFGYGPANEVARRAADALEHVPLPRAQREPGGLPAALGRGRPRARERPPARPLDRRPRRRAGARLPRRARRLRHARA